MSKGWMHPAAGVALVVLGSVIAALALLIWPPETLKAVTAGDGWVEITAGWLYLPPALLMLFWARRDFWLMVPGAVIVLALGAREMQMHRAFTTDSMLKLAYYTRDVARRGGESIPIPLFEKLLAGGILILLVSVLVFFIHRHGRRWLAALKRRDPAAVTVGIFLIWLPYTKLWDAGPRLLRDWFGYHIPSEATAFRVGAYEEMIEVLLPLLLLLMLYQWRLSTARHDKPVSA